MRFIKNALFALSMVAFLGLAGCGTGISAPMEANPAAAEKNPLAGSFMPEFATTTLAGDKVGNEVFAEYDLTMLNIWGSFCGPCIDEMPEIAKLAKELKSQRINVIGILVDEDTAAAKQILADSGAKFTNIVMDENLQVTLGKFQYVPTTIFVDPDGKVMDEFAIGARGYKEYKALVKAALSSSLRFGST